MPQGAAQKRPGTVYVAESKSNTKIRLLPFEYSTTQSYIVELGNQYLRFYTNNAQIPNGGNPYEVVTPYLTADLFELKYEQSADVLFITHPDYEVRKLSRVTNASWTITVLGVENGPFRNQNTDVADTNVA